MICYINKPFPVPKFKNIIIYLIPCWIIFVWMTSNTFSILRLAPSAATPDSSNASSSILIQSLQFTSFRFSVYLCNLKSFKKPGISSNCLKSMTSGILPFDEEVLLVTPKSLNRDSEFLTS